MKINKGLCFFVSLAMILTVVFSNFSFVLGQKSLYAKNDTKYEERDSKQIHVSSLEEFEVAIENAVEEDTTVIILDTDIALEKTIKIDKKIKIKGNDHILTRKAIDVTPDNKEISNTIALYRNQESQEYEAKRFINNYEKVVNFSAFEIVENGDLIIENVTMDGSASGWSYLTPKNGENWIKELGINPDPSGENQKMYQGPVYYTQNGEKIYGYEFIPDSQDVLSTKPLVNVKSAGKLTLNESTIQNFLGNSIGMLINAQGTNEKKAEIELNASIIQHCASSSSGIIYGIESNYTINQGTELKENYAFSYANHALFQIYTNSNLTINDASISNNYYHGNGVIGLYGNSKFDLNGGSISENRYVSALNNNNYGCCVYVHKTSIFNMYNGIISNNDINFCGVISTKDTNPSVVLNGGTIEKNNSVSGREEVIYVGSGTVNIKENMIVHGFLRICSEFINDGVINGDLSMEGGHLINNNKIIGNIDSNGSKIDNKGEIKGNLVSKDTELNLNEEYIKNHINVIRKNLNGDVIEKMYLEDLSYFSQEDNVESDEWFDIQLTKNIPCYSKQDPLDFFGIDDGLRLTSLEIDNKNIIQLENNNTFQTIGIGKGTLTANALFTTSNKNFKFSIGIEVIPQELVVKYTNAINNKIIYEENKNYQISDFLYFSNIDNTTNFELIEGSDIEISYVQKGNAVGEKNKGLPTKAGQYDVVIRLLNPNYIFLNGDNLTSSEIVIPVEVYSGMESINRAPEIIAKDVVLTVGEKFDPLTNVIAKDAEDGEILLAKQNIISNDVDTSKAGVYHVTYKVIDKNGASATVTISVTVKENEILPEEKPETPVKPENPKKPEIEDKEVIQEEPKTGVKTMVGLYTGLLIISGGIFIILNKKKKLGKN